MLGVVGILGKTLMCCCHCVLQDRSGQGGPGAGDASAKIYSHWTHVIYSCTTHVHVIYSFKIENS